nr:MAG TPA: hypothetical protein [Caudoviricetes sp.]DAU26146.1 MAG TPA: hypothetical protein [Caudoviricetes sp.]
MLMELITARIKHNVSNINYPINCHLDWAFIRPI